MSLILRGCAMSTLAATTLACLIFCFQFLPANKWLISFFIFLPFIGSFVVVLAAPLSIIAIFVFEIFGARHVLFYVAAGALNGSLSLALVAHDMSANPDPNEPLLLMSDAEAPLFFAYATVVGIIAGIVYWYVTGRSAGRFLGRNVPISENGPSDKP